MTICEVVKEAQNNRKCWGNPATIESLSACTDAVSGRMVDFKNLLLTDTYDEAYLRAMGLDFTRMNLVTVSSLIYTILVCDSSRHDHVQFGTHGFLFINRNPWSVPTPE